VREYHNLWTHCAPFRVVPSDDGGKKTPCASRNPAPPRGKISARGANGRSIAPTGRTSTPTIISIAPHRTHSRAYGDGEEWKGKAAIYGEDQELRNMFKRTAQPGLWLCAGGLAQCRIGSKYLGLQIKACEEGLLPPLA
jgi:hypothetical protein